MPIAMSQSNEINSSMSVSVSRLSPFSIHASSASGIVVGGLLLFFSERFITSTAYLPVVFTGLALVALSVGMSAMVYLRGTQPARNHESEPGSLRRLGQLEITLASLAKSMHDKIEKISSIPQSSILDLRDGERQALIEHLKQQASSDLADQIFGKAKEMMERDFIKQDAVATLRLTFSQTKGRLINEIEALTRRGNLNLVIGGLTTLVAVSLLSYIVLTAEPMASYGSENGDTNLTNYNEFLWYYVPRITLAIFIEVFSFFFLRLYRSSLADIKYYQNELTTIDAKFVALEAALAFPTGASATDVVKELANTERNSRLSSGQSTVELERLRMEKNAMSEFLNSAKEFLRSARPGHD